MKKNVLTGHQRPRPTAIGLAVAMAFVPAMPAWALPTGEQIVAGQVSVARPTTGNMLIHQGTGSAIVNWNSFSIGGNETVRINQPGASSVILNRVTGNNPSSIYGQLSANGKVFLVNPSGVLFGEGARVDVGSLIASTLSIGNADFLAGRYTFSGPGGSLVNRGAITAAQHGTVALLGGSVTNEGTIAARLGTVAMGAGRQITLDLAGDGLSQITVSEAQLGALVANGGAIVADGGQVFLSARAVESLASGVINQTGVIRAQSLVERNGRIVLDGGDNGTTLVSGRIDATGSATGTKGGEIRVLGNHVGVVGNAALDASGDSGGGRLLVGGGLQGKDPAVHNASATFVGRDASLRADAISDGNGGTVVAWGNETTRVHGTFSARGGSNGGDGGMIETSGKFLDTAGLSVSAAAPKGLSGQWLLDPIDIDIVTGAAGSSANAGTVPDFVSSATPSTIADADIEAALNAGTSVTITTSPAVGVLETGTIVIDANTRIEKTAGGDATLTLNAIRNIQFAPGSGIVSTAGRLNVNLNSDSSGVSQVLGGVTVTGGALQMDANTEISTNGGNVSIYGQSDSVGGRARGLSFTISDDPFAVTPNGVLLSQGASINTCVGVTCAGAGGDVTIRGRGSATVVAFGAGISADAGAGVNVQGGLVQTGSGALTIDGIGGRGGAGVVLADGATASTTIASGSGNISIVGAGSGIAGDGSSTGQIQPFGISSNGALISSVSGNIGLSGTGAVAVQSFLGGGAFATTGRTGLDLRGTDITSTSGGITLSGTGSIGGAGFLASSGTRVGATVGTLIESQGGSVSITGVGIGTPGPADISSTDPFGIVMGGGAGAPVNVRSGAGIVSISGTGGDISNTISSATASRFPATGILTLGSSTVEGANGVSIVATGGSDGVSVTGTGSTPIENRDAFLAAQTVRSPGGLISITGATDGLQISNSTIDASRINGTGGNIQIVGSNVGLISTTVNANGSTGGGQIAVEADNVAFVAANAVLTANATTGGNGGTIRVTALGAAGPTSASTVRAYGSLSATGAGGGSGGTIETSGFALDVNGISVNASSAGGSAGTWIIDPIDVTISDGATVGGSVPDFVAGAPGANVQDTDISNALSTGTNVSISTSGAVGVPEQGNLTMNGNAEIIKSGGGNATLTLNAHNNISIFGSITSTAGALGIDEDAGRKA